MGINKDSNAYTVIFATAMVVVVGGLLAFVSTSLKPLQEDNVRNEKKQLILKQLVRKKLNLLLEKMPESNSKNT